MQPVWTCATAHIVQTGLESLLHDRPQAPTTFDEAGCEDTRIMGRCDNGFKHEALAESESDGSEFEACASAHDGTAILALI